MNNRKEFHYKNEEPFEYSRDGKRCLSSLATSITELYPPSWEQQHGENAEKEFLTLTLSLFGKDFPEGGTRATLLKPEQEEELIEDVQLPDNLDEFLQYREGVQHNTDEQHGEPPLEGEDEEFTGELIYPE